MTACSHQAIHSDYAAFVREPRIETPGADYRLGVPDQIVVTVSRPPFQEEHRLTLAHPGEAYVPGYAAVPAAGRTSGEVAEALRAQTPDADIAVQVETYASQKVFVFGQVQRTGGQPYHGANTVLQVLAEARPNARADVRHVQVLRPSPDGQFRRRMTVDLDAMVRQADTTLDVVLDEGDIVYVPATALGSIGLAWQQLFSMGSPSESHDASHQAPASAAPSQAVATVDPQMSEATQAQTQALIQLQQAISELRGELHAMRQDNTASLAQHSHTPAHEPVHFDGTTSRATNVYAANNDPRGGARKQPEQPEGVRFWGP